MLAVTNAKATVAKLREQGVAISNVEEGEDCDMAFTKDPDGVSVIVHQRKA